nr:hypothetical protein [Gemmatimonadaceae bacterium]
RSAWFRSLYRHQPATHLATMTMPILAVYGELDRQVPAAPSLGALHRLYAGPRRPLLTDHLLPGLNHLLQPAVTGRLEEYRTIETTISPEVLRRVTEWLRQFQ